MDTPRQSKMTAFDLVTFICFTTPVITGWMEGSKIGLVARLVGVILGVVFGILSAIGFRSVFLWITKRFGPEEKSGVRLAVENILFLIGQIVWLCGMSFLIFVMIQFIIHHVAA